MGHIKRAAVVLGAVLAAAAGASWADAAYPSQPIRLVVPFPAGGGVDGAARLLVQPLAERLGQSVFIDNRTGAAGNIGTQVAAQARPDGYTLLMASVSPNAVNVHLYKQLGYDPVKDFAPVGIAMTVPNILVVKADAPFKTVNDLIAAAKAKPGSLNYGSAGVGASQHLATESFRQQTGVEMVHVQYRGSAPAQAALMGGEIDLIFDSTSVLPLVMSGKLRALAVTSGKRLPVLPNVPTLEESGVHGVVAGVWYGVMAPAGTPAPVVARLNDALNAVLAAPEVKQRMEAFGAQGAPGRPEALSALVASDIGRYRDLVKTVGIQPQ
ncbi:Bug family tripartite tricarboxylate transporter substrate binding protein [Pseudorhodoferax sp.]|uniref:Bug family tripartite tricarboxylate transporter substrate binding protein n=1 Tax=Pseudorhodoferax sp. TaxID=1993553 RepID=UPI002DD6848E|nr:tripartite tricarboxylate transporter substrate binding protein [Pseudorhodoferax sp.]